MRTQLILKGCDISNLGYQSAANIQPVERTVDYNAKNGFINRRQSQMTWKDINLRDILGELYNTNTDYVLELTSITFFVTSNLSFYSSNESDRSFNIFMSGLPNMQSYSSQGINQEALLCSLRLPSGSYCNTFNFSNNFISFRINNNQFCDLTISYKDLLTNALEPSSNGTTVDYPYAQFVFNIIKT